MSSDQQSPRSGWGHKIREENRELREQIAGLRKESATLQRELQNTWRLLDHVPGSLVLVQQEKILLANQTACKETGYTQNELLSLEISDLLGSDSVSSALSFYRRNATGQSSPHQRETSLKCKDGQILPVELRATKTLHRGKTAFLFHFVFLDQRNAQEKRRTEFEKSNAFLRMAFGFKQELELYRNLIEQGRQKEGPGVLEEGALKFLEGVDEIGAKEVLLSQRLRCMARTEYDPSELSLMGLSGLIETAVDVAFPKRNGGSRPDADFVTIHTFLRAASWVYGCVSELGDVFSNLILNAVEALPDGGDVYVTTEEHSGFAHIYIQDNGVGMSKGIMKKAFDPFFTTKEGTWRGLGLSLSHAIVDRHQGEIGIISEEGRGSTFVVKLPLARDVASRMKTGAAKKGLKGSHILIIGEEGVLTDICYTLFADRCEGVTVTSSYKEGFRLLRDTQIDLIIADQEAFRIDMSKIIEGMKGLRPEVPVVLINAGVTLGLRRTGGKPGADLIVSRPLDVDAFVSQLAVLMGEGGALNGQ